MKVARKVVEAFVAPVHAAIHKLAGTMQVATRNKIAWPYGQIDGGGKKFVSREPSQAGWVVVLR